MSELNHASAIEVLNKKKSPMCVCGHIATHMYEGVRICRTCDYRLRKGAKDFSVVSIKAMALKLKTLKDLA